MKREHEHVYAIVRVDEFQGRNCPTSEKVTVKEVVWDEGEADREVARLNALPTKPAETYYYSQVTRLVKSPAPILESEPAPNEANASGSVGLGRMSV